MALCSSRHHFFLNCVLTSFIILKPLLLIFLLSHSCFRSLCAYIYHTCNACETRRDGQNAHFWGKNAHFLHFLAKWYFIYQKSAFFDIWSYFSLYFPLRKKKATNRGVEWRDFYLAPSMWEVNCIWSRNLCMSYVLNRKMHIFGKKCTFECTFNAHF